MENKTRGGVRVGAGAPKKEVVAKGRSIKLTDAEWAVYQDLGGTKALRENYLKINAK